MRRPRSRRRSNPPPAEAALAVFVLREVLACVFVLGWLVLFTGELLTGRYVLPFWFHVVAVGVLAYALGVGVGQLTAARPPSARTMARAAARRG